MNVTLSRRRLVLLVAVTLVVLSAALLGSFPARAIVAQRADTATAEAQLDDIEAEIARLQGRVDRLNDPEEVQRLAREKYGYVPPGTESYRVITPSAGDVPVPDGWPFLLTAGG
jgi:cell division protein FtsB